MRVTVILALLIAAIVGGFYAYDWWAASAGEEAHTMEEEMREDKVVTGSNTIEQETDVYTIEATYPTGTVTDERVERYIRDTIDEFVATIGETQTVGDGTYEPPPGILSITYDVYRGPDITSYLVEEYHYTGGANGIALITTFTFDAQSSPLSLGDIVPEERRVALVGAIRDELYEINGIQASDESVFGDAISELRFEDLDTYYITETELIIAFSEYEVAAGAAGAIRITLPRATYSEL